MASVKEILKRFAHQTLFMYAIRTEIRHGGIVSYFDRHSSHSISLSWLNIQALEWHTMLVAMEGQWLNTQHKIDVMSTTIRSFPISLTYGFRVRLCLESCSRLVVIFRYCLINLAKDLVHSQNVSMTWCHHLKNRVGLVLRPGAI